ncbi:MAG: hypothetical protein KGP27_04660 [Hyphomicrobiales bacterium]|nr:hypothetical protein [Hyphomicrobiales bacterium]
MATSAHMNCDLWERRRAGAIAVSLAIVAFVYVLLAAGPLRAQGAAAQQPVIAISPALFVEAGTTTPIPLRIRPIEAIEKGSFVRIRGLPAAATLSEGYVIASGVRAVPLFGLQNLSLVAPAELQGRSDITISLVNIEGVTIAEARSVLVVVAPGAAQTPATAREAPRITPPAPVPAQPPAPPPGRMVPQPPVLPEQDQARALGFHSGGEAQLKAGNIVAARRFLERAADIGLGPSALLLGDTYEPGELARLRVMGLQPDIEAARRWYERALQLGVPEAVERLRRLPAKP